MVAGVALGDLVAMSLSLMGLGAVMLASATLFTTMKWGGALYLANIGIRMILGARQATARIASVSDKTGKRAFRDAAMSEIGRSGIRIVLILSNDADAQTVASLGRRESMTTGWAWLLG